MQDISLMLSVSWTNTDGPALPNNKEDGVAREGGARAQVMGSSVFSARGGSRPLESANPTEDLTDTLGPCSQESALPPLGRGSPSSEVHCDSPGAAAGSTPTPSLSRTAAEEVGTVEMHAARVGQEEDASGGVAAQLR